MQKWYKLQVLKTCT